MEGETILCIATRRWGSLWRSTQQIMSRIAKQNRVLFFEPGRDPDKPVLSEMYRNLSNLRVLRTQTVQQNLTVIQTPSSLPIMRRHLPPSVLQVTLPWVSRINTQILMWQIRRAMKMLQVEAPILWLYTPYHADLVGKVGEKLACYFVYDEFADFIYNTRIKETLRQWDNRLTSQVDIVFACSPPLYERRKSINPSTYLILNAADFDLFNRALAPNRPLPADIASIPRPIIGYAGLLEYHIDVELLRRVAEAFPACSLVLIGPDRLPSSSSRDRLKALHNVYFLGQKPHEQLPDYLQAFDVALLPYLLIEQIVHAYPLKLHEYLAAGRAIVSVRLPELQRHRDVVRIADSYDEFICLVREALNDYSQEAIAARLVVARQHTWDRRVEEIYHVLQQQLLTKHKEGML